MRYQLALAAGVHGSACACVRVRLRLRARARARRVKGAHARAHTHTPHTPVRAHPQTPSVLAPEAANARAQETDARAANARAQTWVRM